MMTENINTDETIRVLIKKNVILWNKFRKPADMDAVICPFDEKACTTLCPHCHIEGNKYLCFTCTGVNVRYPAKIEWENYPTEER